MSADLSNCRIDKVLVESSNACSELSDDWGDACFAIELTLERWY
jgi:hypothetical protein